MKVHVRVERGGKLLVMLLTRGQRHEQTVFEHLIEQGTVKRPSRGRKRLRPTRVCGDKGYSSGKARRYLRRGIGSLIPRRKNERAQPVSTGRPIANGIRRIAIRYEKQIANYLGIWTIAAILDWR